MRQIERKMEARITVRNIAMMRKCYNELKAKMDSREGIFSSIIDNGCTLITNTHVGNEDVSIVIGIEYSKLEHFEL